MGSWLRITWHRISTPTNRRSTSIFSAVTAASRGPMRSPSVSNRLGAAWQRASGTRIHRCPKSTCYEKLRSLVSKGCVQLVSSDRDGTRVRARVPSEINGVIPVIITGAPVPLDEADDARSARFGDERDRQRLIGLVLGNALKSAGVFRGRAPVITLSRVVAVPAEIRVIDQRGWRAGLGTPSGMMISRR